jgi:hypothetical protein
MFEPAEEAGQQGGCEQGKQGGVEERLQGLMPKDGVSPNHHQSAQEEHCVAQKARHEDGCKVGSQEPQDVFGGAVRLHLMGREDHVLQFCPLEEGTVAGVVGQEGERDQKGGNHQHKPDDLSLPSRGDPKRRVLRRVGGT